MTEVFILQHEYELDGHDEAKLIGVYSSRSEAEAAITRLSKQPGFSDHPDGFCIDPYLLDRDHWKEGFSTVVPILVGLHDEGVDVWRPVQAVRLPDGNYRITSKNPDPNDEHWAFPSGSVVECQEQSFEGEVQLVAVSLAKHAS
jgi:hypothetical protein